MDLAVGCPRKAVEFKHPLTIVPPGCSGVGVSKPISSIPLFSQIFTTVKTHINYKMSSSYLTVVTAAQLWRHLTNMKVILSI